MATVREDWRKWRGLESLAVLVVACGYFTHIYSHDFWWHAATGRWILQHGDVPAFDPFSYTLTDQPWIDGNWLGAVVLYGAYAIGGAWGIALLKLAIGAAVGALTAGSLRLLSVGLPARIAGILLVGGFGITRWTLERPASLGAVFAALGLMLVLLTWTRESRAYRWLLPLGIVWSFLHPGAVLTIPLAALLLGDEVVRRQEWRRLVELCVVVLTLVGLLVLTPRGHEILQHASTVRADSLILNMTAEWAPVRFGEAQSWGPLLVVLGSLGAMLVEWQRGGLRRAAFFAGLSLLAAVVGLRHMRMVPMGVLLATPAFCVSLDGALRKAAAWTPKAPQFAPILVIALLTFHSLAIGGLWTAGKLGAGRDGARVATATVTRLLSLPEGRVINSLGIGGYLIWREVPGGVFIDGRTVQVYDERFVREEYALAVAGGEALERVADRYDVTYGIAHSNHQLGRAMMSSPAWVPVLHGSAASLFVRHRAAGALARQGVTLYPLIRYVDDEAEMRTYVNGTLRDPARREELLRELTMARRRGEDGWAVERLIELVVQKAPELGAQLEGTQ